MLASPTEPEIELGIDGLAMKAKVAEVLNR